MDYVHKLPFLMGGSISFIIGFISYNSGLSASATYIRMAVGMVVFFVLGLYVRGFIYQLEGEVRDKIKEKEKEISQNENNSSGTNIDYVVEGEEDNIEFEMNNETLFDEEFTPLNVNSVKIKD